MHFINPAKSHQMSAHFGRAVPVGLRKFPLLFGKTLEGTTVTFPHCLEPATAPFHLVTLNFKNKHVWNARTWNSVHSSLDILSQHSPGAAPGMFFVWLFPLVHRLWAPVWRRRCKAWAREHGIAERNVISVYGDRDEITGEIGVHNDGRQYAFLLSNAGDVLFAADGRYNSNKHDFHIHKAIQTKSNQKAAEAQLLQAKG